MYFPLTCVDKFFIDPNYVVKFAEEAEYIKTDGGWPGYRSKPLYEIHPTLFDLTCRKIFSLFYSEQEFFDLVWNVEMSFQKIVPLDNQDNLYPDGWVHSDGDFLISGVIYLNEDNEIDTGTSIYVPYDLLKGTINYEVKRSFYSGTLTDFNLYNRSVKENNDQFEETITVKNKFNRLIMYDAKNFHAAKNIMRIKKPRYTIVFFVKKLVANRFPVPQSRCFTI